MSLPTDIESSTTLQQQPPSVLSQWNLHLSSCLPFSLLYATLCSVYLVVGVNRRRLWQKAALKCLPILSLLALCFWRAQQKDFDSFDEQNHPERGSNIRVLVFALSLSCCGDALLVMRGTLGLFGILSFAVAQCV